MKPNSLEKNKLFFSKKLISLSLSHFSNSLKSDRDNEIWQKLLAIALHFFSIFKAGITIQFLNNSGYTDDNRDVLKMKKYMENKVLQSFSKIWSMCFQTCNLFLKVFISN